MSADLLIKKARLASGEELRDIYISDGKIDRIGAADSFTADTAAVIDAGGRYVIPGMIDPHVHMRCPGMEEKEDWASGGRAALSGGVTTVIDMPNTMPATETMEALELKRAAAAEAGGMFPRRLFWAGCSPESLPLLPELLAEPDVAGVKLFFSETSANSSSSDIDFITEAFLIAAGAGKPAAVHSELAALLQPAAWGDSRAGAGRMSPLRLHNHRRPAAAAVAGTALALELSAVTGCRLYLCHLSAMPEFAMVHKHKEAYGSESVIAELTPHHLLLDEEHSISGGYASWAKVNPPLRSAADREAAAAALLNGTIDCIGSDHAPHRLAEKDMTARDFNDCPSGFPGLETELGFVAGFLKAAPAESTAGTLPGGDWVRMLSKLTNGSAAEVFGLTDRNAVESGKLADLVILGDAKVIDPAKNHTKAKYSPFSGMEMPVSVYKTIVGGTIIEQ